jgi:hypothetical protein
MFVKPANWKSMTSEQKFFCRLDQWEKSDGIPFVSPEAKTRYEERIHRLRNAIELKGTDRPICQPMVGDYILKRAGLNGVDMLYHHEKMVDPSIKFVLEFDPDSSMGAFGYPGKAFETLDFKTYFWAGQKLGPNLTIQTVEGEYMTPDEYAEFSMDPSAFWLHKYLPRMFGALEPMRMLTDLPRITEIVDVGNFLMPFGNPEFQEMLYKLIEAGKQNMSAMMAMGQIFGGIAANGYPGMATAFVKAPFDFLGDTLRGTKGIMMDMYRRPKDLLKACDAYVPLLVSQITRNCDAMGLIGAMYPLHKGADGFMSQEQFDKFYWPSLKAVILGLWEEGIASNLFAEGGYNTRLETVADMPKYSTMWLFDQTDMRQAKKYLEGNSLIQGNVPASLMSTGTVDQLKAYCEDLLTVYAGSPGFILSNGAGVETTTDEHVRTMINIVRK